MGPRWPFHWFGPLETSAGERDVGLDEALQIAAVLDLSPTVLFLPSIEDGRVAIAPELVVPAELARRWLRGQQPLSGQDERLYRTEVSDEEWIVLQNNTIRFMRGTQQAMIDAMVAGDKDQMARLADKVNDELERLAATEGTGRP